MTEPLPEDATISSLVLAYSIDCTGAVCHTASTGGEPSRLPSQWNFAASDFTPVGAHRAFLAGTFRRGSD